jgi:hypothetical protein
MQTLQNELDRLAGIQTASGKNSAAPQKKRKMSAESNAKLSTTMTAKWVRLKTANVRAEKSKK